MLQLLINNDSNVLIYSELNKNPVNLTANYLSLNLNINRRFNLNTHFPTYKSEMLLTLTVWQYWWWLSFVWVIVAFNKLILKFFTQNTLKIEPKVHTSLKSNGRWGDLMASLFPVFWCANILVHSNFILRVIENHTESCMYVLRVRGKQWYWVYKFSVNIQKDSHNAAIIIGRGNKLKVTYNVNQQIPDNNTIPRNRWNKKINKFVKINKTLVKKPLILTKHYIKPLHNLQSEYSAMIFWKLIKWNNLNRINVNVFKRFYKHDKFYFMTPKRQLSIYKTYKCYNNKLIILKHLKTNTYRQYNRFFFNIQQQPKSVWSSIKNNTIIHFKSLKTINLTNKQKIILKKIKPLSITEKKHVVSKLRMISTYNTLVLPINVNITVITNSFDVVHSWFIPGLGLKFDCIPGRSTHYTLKIHKTGIYYGHCAEVCGRFHHHMPIKICALPLHHFMYYYNTYYKL